MRGGRNNPKFSQIFRNDVDNRIRAGATHLAIRTQANLSYGSRRGRKHRGLPNQSSAPGEFPQYQDGELQSSIAAKKIKRFHYRVGAFDVVQGKLNRLEFAPPSLGGRQFLSKSIENNQALDSALDIALKFRLK